jgi:hypothetical protein
MPTTIGEARRNDLPFPKVGFAHDAILIQGDRSQF